jgi:site-specific recombinase XerD
LQCKTEKEQAKAAGLVETDTPYTLAQLVAEFLQYKEVTKKSNTLDFYRKNLLRFVDLYGHLEARKLLFKEASAYISKLQKDHLANTTINHHLRSAKAVLNYGVEAGVLVKNPWKHMDELQEHERKRTVTDEEFELLLKVCDKCIAYRGQISREDNGQTMKDVLRILRFTALRPGELRKLR